MTIIKRLRFDISLVLLIDCALSVTMQNFTHVLKDKPVINPHSVGTPEDNR